MNGYSIFSLSFLVLIVLFILLPLIVGQAIVYYEIKIIFLGLIALMVTCFYLGFRKS